MLYGNSSGLRDTITTMSYIKDSGSEKNIFREISKNVSVELISASNLFIETDEIDNENKNLGILLKNIINDLDEDISLSDNYLNDLDKHIDNVLRLASKLISEYRYEKNMRYGK